MKSIHAPHTFTAGIAIAPVFVYAPADITPNRQQASDTAKEHARFDAAIAAASADLQALAVDSEIFAAHAELVQDPELRDAVHAQIDEKGIDAEWALADTIDSFCELFSQMEDEYMRARGADIRDIGGRLMRALKGCHDSSLSDIAKKVIVVAADLLPSDTAQMNFDLVVGFITQEGGPTSHVAIIAKNRGIPALVGVTGILQEVQNDMPAAMDAESGEIVLSPDEETLQRFTGRQDELRRLSALLAETAALPSRSADGRDVLLCANVGNVNDIRMALVHHPDGVGLFRTEFLFMDSEKLPTEEQQFEVYREAVQLLGNRELVVRTLDIGGDKPLPYLDMGQEANPFLGYRAIRICLDRKDIFATQLRAMLRASAFGNLKIMYPMIVHVGELDAANALLAACKEELRLEGTAFNEKIQVGMMIETPASVIMADAFAARVDFFSIGTNDLTQYVLAADRGNERIAYLYDAFDPAVLRSIGHVIAAGHKAGIPVGMCGEFASNKEAFHLLLGMGLDEFSMSAASIPQTKALLRASNYAEAQKRAAALPACQTREQVRQRFGK